MARPRSHVLPAVVVLALITATPLTVGRAGAESGSTAKLAPSHAPIAVPASNRPKNCPAPSADPNAPGHEKRTLLGRFPWPKKPPGVRATNYLGYDHTPHTAIPTRPSNWSSGGADWKLTSARIADQTVNRNPQELCGVEGNSVDKAWETTTGRPTTVIAITDSGIEWCRTSIVDKVYLNRGALPPPENAHGHAKTGRDRYDRNGDGVFNVRDYAHDPRVAKPYFCGAFISPEDLIRTFGTKGGKYYYGHHPQRPAGFTEAIAGWNFLDNNNDPYDDVHYDHGSGEAEDSTGTADTADGDPGVCPNCMVLPIRVGESFIGDSDNFAQGVMFAVDSGARVIQEALGTYDVTSVTQQAINYANAHGVPIVASAADEEAEHHNLPGYLPGTIVVNSVTESAEQDGVPLQVPKSYLHVNGCTNYGANIAVTVESSSCSSEATGKTGGIVGLAESAADDAVARHRIRDYPGLRTVSGAPVPLSSNEIQQLVTMTADDVDFSTAAPPYGPADNFAEIAPYPTRRFTTSPGFDMFTGYGRINAASIMRRIARGDIPPEAAIDGRWFRTFTTHRTVVIRGLVGAVRASHYRWMLQAAAGVQPRPGAWHTMRSGNGHGGPSGVRRGTLARIPASRIAKLFSPSTSFRGGPVAANGSPNPDRFTFSLRLVVADNHHRLAMDRRADFLHNDPSLINSFRKHYGGSIDAPPTLAPLGPHYTNALLIATTDGVVHAYRANGDELPGWPVHTAPLPVHRGERAYTSHAVTDIPDGPIIGGLAVGDLADARGRHPDVVASDYAGHVYAWNAHGRLLPGFPKTVRRPYGGPAARDQYNRLQRAFLGAPALASLQGGHRLDVVAAAMDRHVYAWTPDGRTVPGWPKLLIDHSKVHRIIKRTDKIVFAGDSKVDQGSPLVDTPAIGALSGHGRPDVVVGADESYDETPNISIESPDAFALGKVPLLSPGNSRVYALDNHGKYLPGWPVHVADFDVGLLPDVGDGTTGSPALADLTGNGQLDVGTATSVGPPYILKPNGQSEIGTGIDGKPLVGSTAVGGIGNSPEVPTIAVEGMPIFAPLGSGAPGISLITPAASLGKALDVAIPDQQLLNNNEIDAWNSRTGLLQPEFPQTMNDLQFIVSPIVGNVGGDAAGPYLVSGSATYDVRAINGLGQEANGFPKFDGGWMVNSPSFGRLGTRGHQVLAVGTREGNLFVWRTRTTACASSGAWPRAHHDLFNDSNLAAPPVMPPAKCR